MHTSNPARPRAARAVSLLAVAALALALFAGLALALPLRASAAIPAADWLSLFGAIDSTPPRRRRGHCV